MFTHCTYILQETFVPGKIRGLMDYLLNEQYREVTAKKEEMLMTDEMLFALIADIVLAGGSPCLNINLAFCCQALL